MLRQTVNCVRNRIVPQFRCQSTKSDVKESIEKLRWDLFVGVQIERLPIITKTLNKLERDYQVHSQIKTQVNDVILIY